MRINILRRGAVKVVKVVKVLIVINPFTRFTGFTGFTGFTALTPNLPKDNDLMGANHRSKSLFSQNLKQHGMRYAAINNMH